MLAILIYKGVTYFRQSTFSTFLDNDIKEKGEYQLTNALENMKQKGAQFVPGKVDEWMDCGNKEITVATNSRILELSQEEGQSLVAKSVVLENSKIIEPCYIGEHVKLINAQVGPNVSLGENSIVENATITNSLIQTNTIVKNAVLDNAMIGNHVEYNGKYTAISIGDYSKLV